MNFIEADLVAEEGGKIALVFGGQKIYLPEGKASKLDRSYIGKRLILGIRPEDIYDDEGYIAATPETTVDTKVDITELMGAETYLYLIIEGKQFVARVDPRTTAKAGDNIKVAFDGNKIHLFDKDTEMAILN